MNGKQGKACATALRQVFGMPGYRPGQKAAASCLLSGRDLLCILPTGAGKSLCWQLPAVVHPGWTVVISPLIALMHDQMEGLRRRGVAAETINSLMPPEERFSAENRIRSGEARILFVSPERLETPAFLALCRDCPPWLVVVDEAHCAVQWGEDFRPAYSGIHRFVSSFRRRPVLCAMTATADESMQRQLVRQLCMARPRRVMLPVIRDNLIYSVRTTASPTEEILRLMRRAPCRTVVFCRTRQRTELLTELLRREGFAAEHYHAGLDREARLLAQERFRTGETLILAATTAFGMGIDIPDIRRVIHDRLPPSVTDLVQQSGRAGRDGAPAECIVLLGVEAFFRAGRVLEAVRMQTRCKPLARRRAMAKSWRPLRRVLQVLLREKCIVRGISAAFGQRARPCGQCSACLRGRMTARLPDLPRWSEEGLRLWLMKWQLSALARKRGVPLRRLASSAEMRRMARTLQPVSLGDEEVSRAAMRLLRAMAPSAFHAEDVENGRK